MNLKKLLCWAALSAAATVGALGVPVTFQVDMSFQAALGTFNPDTDTVEARGSFNNGWAAGFTLSRASQDSLVYTGVFDVAGNAGANYEYKFVRVSGGTDNWESSSNRPFTLASSAQTLPISFFNNEWDGAPLNVTFQVNMATQMAAHAFDPEAGDVVELRGEFNGWAGGTIMTQDPENPDVYVYTMEVGSAPGAPVQYKFHIQRASSDTWENDPNRSFIQADADQTLPVVYFNNVTGVPIKAAVSVAVDMTAQIAGARFDPASQEVYLRGNKVGWGTPAEGQGLKLDEDTTRPGVYTNTMVLDSVITGDNIEFKFTIWDPNTFGTTWEDGANKVLAFTGSEPQNEAGYFTKSYGPVYFNNLSPNEILSEDTVVTFRVDMNGARRTGGGAAFDPGVEGVWINGTFVSNGNWGPWGAQSPDLQMFDDGQTGGDTVAGDGIYSFQTTLLRGSPTRVTYKYGIDSADNEAPSGSDHVRYIRTTGTYTMPIDKFGTQTQETLGVGDVHIERTAAGKILLTWEGRPGIKLQKITDLGNIAGATEVSGTDGQSSIELPADGNAAFFRLVSP